MKIALAQLNVTVGALRHNREKISWAAKQARERGVDLLVGSELCLCGYPPLDLLGHQDFISCCYQELLTLAKQEAHSGLALLIGYPGENQNSSGKALYNSVALLVEGKIQSCMHKSLLPSYGIFNEERYFESSSQPLTPLEYQGLKLGVHICEDAWADQVRGGHCDKRGLYRRNPVQELAASQADLFINLSASPWSFNHDKHRSEIFIKNCERWKTPGVMINQVGANDDLIFDGNSLVIKKKGEILGQLPAFQEALAFVSFDAGEKSIQDMELILLEKAQNKNHFISSENQNNQKAKDSFLQTGPVQGGQRVLKSDQELFMLQQALEQGVRDYFRKTGFSQALLGLSGGIDSALVATIACHALGAENVRCIGMPSQYSSSGSIQDARMLCENLGCSFEVIPIHKLHKDYLEALPRWVEDYSAQKNLTEENLQPRIRGTLLMALSNLSGALLLATGNKSELAAGYSTLYGDTCGCLEVIGDIYKLQVYQLADFYNRKRELIPQSILEKAPSAELRPNQKDSDTLPDYEILDPLLHALIEERKPYRNLVESGFDVALMQKVIPMIKNAEYKRRQSPLVLRVQNYAFGRGRLMPIAQGFLPWV